MVDVSQVMMCDDGPCSLKWRRRRRRRRWWWWWRRRISLLDDPPVLIMTPFLIILHIY
jgi:hypothetical protein